MAANFSVDVYGVVVAAEPSYSGSVSFGTTGVPNVIEEPLATIAYADTGERRMTNAEKVKRLTPTARTGELPLSVELVGTGSAYTAVTDVPHHVLLQAAGFSGSFEGSSVIYKRNAADAAYSLAAKIWDRHTSRILAGGLSNFEFGFENPGEPLKAMFNIVGVATVPVTLSAGTWASEVAALSYEYFEPPRATNISFTLNSVTSLVVRSFQFTLDRDLGTNRLDANTAQGTHGFAVGRVNPTCNVTIEATDDIDPFSLRDLGTEFEVTLVVGTDAGNIITASIPQAVIIDITEGADGPVATWDLQLDVHNSLPGLRDDLTLTFS